MASPRVTPAILIRWGLIVVVVFMLAGVAGLILGIPTMEVWDKYSLVLLFVAAIAGGKLLAPVVKRSRERDD
jgi:cytochrome c oxidase subunit IV